MDYWQQTDLVYEYTLDEMFSSNLFQVTLTTPASGYLSMLAWRSPLIAIAHVYYTNWTKVGIARVSNALELDNGTYYVWVERLIRSGYYGFHYGLEPIEDMDPYYAAFTGATSIPYPALLVVLALSTISLIAYIFRRKNRQ